MRLAVIADIHGNADALRAVLADAAREGAERVIVNGDVVNRGPDSVEALELLLARSDVAFTLGNHDDLLRLWHARSDRLPAEWYTDPFWGATAWSAEQLDRAGLLDVAADWPMTLRLGHGDTPALVAHGTADDYREGLSARSRPERVAALADVGASPRLLIGSHIHRQDKAQFGAVTVLNTGAVGSPADGDPRAQYLLLEQTAAGWAHRFRRVPYDRAGVETRFSTSGLLGRGLSAEIFLAELRSARSLYTPYWAWTEAGALPRTPETWVAFLRRALTGA